MLSDALSPKSLALIGASRTPGKLGYDILSNIKHLGYSGKIYPVNPKKGDILGCPSYTSILSVPHIPDLVLIAIPGKYVHESLEECGKRGVQNVVIISAGFKEVGGEGVQREKRIQEIVKKYNMCLIGPNCLGILNTEKNLNASFAEGMPKKGEVGLISQSGAMAVAMIDWAYESGLGFSKIVSMGNKAGVTENELLEYLGNDPKTKVICMYLESISFGREFLDIAQKISQKKPIIIVKSGTSEAGTRAISSHTGSLSGSDVAVSTAFLKAGIIRAHTVEELFDYAQVFCGKKLPKGKRVGIITNAGGPGIMATDALEKTSLVLPSLSEELQNTLSSGLPSSASLHNPVDVIGDALADRYQHAIKTVLQSGEVDSLLVILTPQIMTEVKKTAEAIASLSHEYPHIPVVSAFIGGESVQRGYSVFERNHFPNFIFPARAIGALEKMYEYAEWKKKNKKSIKTKDIPVYKNKALDHIFAQKTSGERLSFDEIQILSDSYSIPSPRIRLAKNIPEALSFAQDIRYPLVMKISSPDIYHKTDAGGIRIDIGSEQELKKAWKEIMENVQKYNPEARREGITMETMVPIGKEIIIGAKKDDQFGHMIVFGLGGIYVEILKDVSFRLAPLSEGQALDMIEEIQTIPLLKGIRGEQSVDIFGVAQVIQKISQLVCDYPRIQEFEINPLIASPGEGIFAVDMKCIVGA